MSKKVLFIYTDWNASEARRNSKGYGGVSYYRVIKPAEALRALGWDVDVVGHDLTERFGDTPQKIWPKVFQQYDAVVVKQMDNPQAAAPMFFFADRYKKPIILDLDDDYFSVKPDQPAWDVYKPGSQKRAIFAASLSLVDAIFVSTEPLREAYAHALKEVYGMEKPIFVLPNCNKVEDWPATPERPNSEIIKIGYAGSITHNSDLEMVMPSILYVLQKYPNARFEILGAMYKKDLDKMLGPCPNSIKMRIRVKNGTHSWDGYPQLLASQGWDIGIAPLIDDKFNRSKSHIKWMEYTMAGIPVIASPTYPYIVPIDHVSVIENGVSGLFARSPEEWGVLLCQLIEDWPQRRRIAANALAVIKQNWQYEQHAHEWANALEDVLCNFQTRRTKTASSKNVKTPAA